MISPASSLRRRIDLLDTTDRPRSDTRLGRFVSVLAYYTNTAMAEEIGEWVTLDPAEADELAGTCRLLAAVSRHDGQDLVTGPLHRDRQLWVANGRHDGSSGPGRSRFSSPREASLGRPSPKPFGVGLYTATAIRPWTSMWHLYLDPYYESEMYPLPWHTWRLAAAGDSSVREITSATEWTEFVAEYAMPGTDPLCPDWRRVAADVDGLHMTLRAVVATQGFQFPVKGGVTAAAYWDVDTAAQAALRKAAGCAFSWPPSRPG
jgi:hypothetical protein